MGFIRLFRWLRGYVLVASNDENVAQFINFLLKSKVKIWDIKKKREYTSFKMFSKDYRRIRKIRHSSKIRIKLKHIGFWGLIRKFNTLIKRKSLLVGFVIYILFLMVMNMFIWNIEIVGNSKINDDIIIGAYTELGVRAGMPKYKIDTYSLKEKLPMKILDVSWCSFNVEGTKLTINITEVSEIDKSNKKIYSNIVASTDGIVKEIDIISGNKSIDVGDVVTKGEVLVSGAPELNSQKFTFSKADIFAQTFKEININIPKMKTYHIRTGKSSSKSIISIFGFKLPLFLDKPHFESSVKRRDKV